VTADSSALFPRNFKKSFPIAVRGEGSWIISSDGRKYLDASGQAAVVSIGHGVQSVAAAIAAQASQIAFAHTTQFHSASAEKLATRLLALAPPNFANGRVYFTSGGSEATETALKLARQFHLESGAPRKFRVVSRRQSYHGSTLGAMSVSGNVTRRAPYQPLLPEWGHIAPCFCYHCPFDKTFPDCKVACADDLESFLAANVAASVSAFIFEPVVGATLGAATPPDGYVQRIAEICRDRGILLVADEIMTGMGRTGKPFAVNHWNVEPDLILVGKGIASGYAPLGAVLISSRVAEAFAKGCGAFQHGFTYQAHPVSTAAGNAWPAVGIAGAVRRRNTVRSLISVTWLGCSARRLTQPSSPIGCSVVEGVRSVVRVLTRPGRVVDGERLSPRFVILARGGPDLGIQRSIDAR